MHIFNINVKKICLSLIIVFVIIVILIQYYKNQTFKKKFVIPKNTIFSIDHVGPNNLYQKEIINEFLYGWENYKKYAWGKDELKPVSKGWINWMGFGLTIVDSLDTLYIMGLKYEFNLAREWVAKNLSFKIDSKVSTFEVTIRILGGLLSAYHFTADNIFLEKAQELGELIHDCIYFHKKTFCSCRIISFSDKTYYDEGRIPLSELASIQIEMRDLSRITQNSKYEIAAFTISKHLHSLDKEFGMFRNLFNTETGTVSEGASINFGGLSDSYYEYLLKQWIQTSGKYPWLLEDFKQAIVGAFSHLIQFSFVHKHVYFGSLIGQKNVFENSMDSLSCFLPGSLALAVLHGFNPNFSEVKHGISNFRELAITLGETCYYILNSTKLKLAPEHVTFPYNNDSDIEFENAKYMQRPEIIESLLYLYHLTKDSKYQKRAWKIFKTIVKNTKLRGGYAGVENVNIQVNQSKTFEYIDKMESFFLSETLKYLYLILDDNFERWPLTSFIFNTEAHILPIYSD